jgi:hypothetical protein
MNATRTARSLKIHSLESLDGRITPSGGFAFHPVAAVAPVASHPITAGAPTYSPNGTPMDKLGQTLNIVYQEYTTYVKDGAKGAYVSSQASKLFFRLPAGTTDGTKTEVEVSIQVPKTLFGQALTDATKLGLEMVASDAAHGIITGYLPVSQLAAAANDASFTSVSPVFKPPSQSPFRFGH